MSSSSVDYLSKQCSEQLSHSEWQLMICAGKLDRISFIHDNAYLLNSE